MKFAATSGQTQGFGVGQLPPGYLPLTAADGLGGLASYTQSAATDVAAQNGQVPSLTAAASTTPTTAPAITPTSREAVPETTATRARLTPHCQPKQHRQ